MLVIATVTEMSSSTTQKETGNAKVNHKPDLLSPQPMVKVVIKGSNNLNDREFSIHKSFLSHYSGLFASKLTKAGQREAEIDIDGVSSNVFGIFIHWLYYQNKGLALYGSGMLLEVWEMGEKLVAPALQNMFMDRLYNLIGTGSLVVHLWTQIFEFAYQVNSDALRRLLRDVLARTNNKAQFDIMIEIASPAMVKEVAVLVKHIQLGLENAEMGPSSDYHVPLRLAADV